MENIQQKTGIIYCRVSSSRQVDKTSLTTQQQSCKEYAQRSGIKVVKVFIELGESAKSKDRTEFNKALALCTNKQKPIDCFIVYKIDRFARNQDDHVTVQAMLKKHGTELRSVTEPIDSTPIGRAMEGVLSVFAEFDNNVRTERTLSGMRERVKQGVWCWPAPLGYYRPNNSTNIHPDPEKAHYIEMIFKEYSKGVYTFPKLAEFISNQGLATKTNKKPSAQLIEKIIKNPIYVGIIDMWGERTKGSFDAIVSEELFQICQTIKAHGSSSHIAPRYANNENFPLRKYIKCTECEKPITGSKSTGRGEKKYAYYHHYSKDCPNTKSIPKETFEQLFIEYLDGITPDKQYEKFFKSIVIDVWKKKYKELDTVNEKLRKEISNLEEERQQVFELHRSGKYSDDEFLEQKELVLSRINKKHAQIQTKRVEEFNMERSLDHCFNFIGSIPKTWKDSSYATQLQLQNRIFENKVAFDGKEFGTATLTPIFELKKTYHEDKSKMVDPKGFEPLTYRVQGGRSSQLS